MDLAEGRLNFRQISIKHGLSLDHAGRIARGTRRPELQEKIDAAALAILRQSRRLGVGLTRVAWSRLGNLAGAGEGVADETQRKASVDILKLAPTDEQVAPARSAGCGGPGLTDLSDATKAKVLAELDGPEDRCG